jgi:hypothetical protein
VLVVRSDLGERVRRRRRMRRGRRRRRAQRRVYKKRTQETRTAVHKQLDVE